MVNEPKFVLDPKKGGMNWGFCQRDIENETITYKAIVVSSTLEHSETK